jgi:23S rRNA (uracil1939-C5)-methyltransferase
VASELRFRETQEADVVDLAHDGRGVARIDGKTVFVDGALPGERVRLSVYKRRRTFDEALLVEILSASPDRVTPACAHFGICGGCSLQHLSPAAQLDAKQRQLLDNLERIGRVKPRHVLEPIRGPAFGYRRRARLGVKYVHKKGRVLAGFREREKPYIADLRRCETIIARFATLPEDLAALVDGLSIRDKVPQVEVAAGDETAALVFRVLEPLSAEDLERLEGFGKDQRVSIYLQSGGLDTIRPLGNASPLSYTVYGGRVTLEFGPADFVQVNRDINIAMIEAAMKLLEPSKADRVLDLFCGLGNFTLPIALEAGTAVGVEGDPALVAKARANAAANGIENAQFHVDNLFEPAKLGSWAEGPYDLVLLDPPRAGAVAIMERMAQWAPNRVVYISCHPGSLARDAGILTEAKGFQLVGAGVMDMFPHTTHVESVAVFERRT